MISDLRVLIVDDIAEAAADYALLVEDATGLDVGFAFDPDAAVAMCMEHNISVVVLDARMPRLSGPQLLKRVREILPDCRAILITGEAELDEVGAALAADFNSYISKADIQKLPQQVLHEFAVFEHLERERFAKSGGRVLYRKRGPFWRHLATYRLISYRLMTDKYTFEAEWEDLVLLSSPGQSEKHTVQTNSSRSLVIETEISTKLASKLGMSTKKFGSLTGELQAELTTKYKRGSTAQTGESESTEVTFTLPPEPADANQIHPISRRIQIAPAYLRCRVNIAIECRVCELPNHLSISVVMPSGRTRVRREDGMSDGTTRSYDLGLK